MNLKKGDEVKIIAGADKGKTAKIAAVLTRSNKVVLEGEGLRVNKCHEKPSQENPDGGIISRACKVDASNVMLVVGKEKKVTRVGYKTVTDSKKKDAKASKVRVAVATKEEIK